MHKIFKYQIPVAERHVLHLPKGSQIVRCEDVDGQFYVWAMVDLDQTETEARHLELYKTGAEIHTPPSVLHHIGNCRIFIQMELMLYVFENTAKRGQA